ncbi:MAG: hypothetical protein AAB263_14650, partial [Planctomycetota bacterium]
MLIIGAIMIVVALLVANGMLDELMKYLGNARAAGQIKTLCYSFGAIGIVVGVWHLWATHKEGNLDYY